MSFLTTLLGGETYLGIDIGTTSIKAVEIERSKKGKPVLKNYGILETYNYLERFNEVLQTSSLKLVDTETATYLKLLIKKAGLKANKVIASLPAFSAFTTLIELPLVPETELRKIMEFQAKQYIPLTLSAVTIDWVKVGERADAHGPPAGLDAGERRHPSDVDQQLGFGAPRAQLYQHVRAAGQHLRPAIRAGEQRDRLLQRLWRLVAHFAYLPFRISVTQLAPISAILPRIGLILTKAGRPPDQG